MALNKTLKKMIWILPLVTIAGGITVYAASASLRGKITVWMWSGKKTLRCNGSDVLVIRGKTAHVGTQVIYALGRCKVRIVDSELSGNTAIYAYENARITVVNSKLSGRSHAVFVYNSAKADIRGSTITSTGAGIHLYGGAEMTLTKSKVTAASTALNVGQGSRAVITDSQLHSTKDRAVYSGTDTELTITGGDLAGKSGLYVGSKTKVTLIRTKLAVRERVFYLSKESVLTVKSCTVKGGKDGVYVGTGSRLRMSKTDLNVTGRPLYASNAADVKLDHCKLKGGKSGIYVSDRAKVRLTQVDLRSNRGGLSVSKGATVMFDGGKLISAGQAIHASRGANITLRNVKLVGKVYKAKGATVTQVGKSGSVDLAAQQATTYAERLKRYKGTACRGVMICYQKHKQWGAVDVTVQVNIDDNGEAKNPAVKVRRRVKAKVRRCLLKNAKKKRIADFTGPRGLLMCRVTGNVQDGVQRLSYTTEYNVDPFVRMKTRSGALPDAD